MKEILQTQSITNKKIYKIYNIKKNLKLNLNKRILNYPHNQITPYLGNYHIIDYKFNTASIITSNFINYDYKLNKTNPSKIFNSYFIKKNNLNIINNNYYKSLNYIINLLNAFFNSLNCIISKPKFINTSNKLIIRLNYYQSNTNNDPLSLNKSINLGYKKMQHLISTNNSLKQKHKNVNMINKKIWIAYLRDFIFLNINKDLEPLSTQNNNILNNISISNNKIKFSNKNIIKIKQKLFNLKQFILRSENLGRSIKFNNKPNIFLNKKNDLFSKKLSILPFFSFLQSKIINIFNQKNFALKRLKQNTYNERNLLLKKNFLNTKQKNLLIKKYNSKIYLGSKKSIFDYYKLSKILSNSSIKAYLNRKFMIKKNFLSNDNAKNIQRFINLNPIKNEIFKEYKYLLNLIIIKFILPNKLVNIIKKSNFISLILNFYNNKYLKKINLNNKNFYIVISNLNEVIDKKKQLKFKIKEIFLSYLKLLNNKAILLTKLNNNVTNSNLLPMSQENTGFNSLGFSGPSVNSNGNNILYNNKLKFKYLGLLLSKILQKNVELQVIKLHNIGLDQNILTKTISLNSKKYKLRILLKNLWKKIQINYSLNSNYLLKNNKNFTNRILNQKNFINNPLIPAKITGIKIRIAGRLSKERIVPKKTVKTVQVGTLNKKNITFLDSASFINKNRKGSFNIKVWMSHSL